MPQQANWLARWSRRKIEAHAAESDPNGADACATERHSPSPVTPADLAGLDSSSDFSRFLAEDVSPDLRMKALRLLWSIDPALSAPDGLIDYTRDYTSPRTPLIA